jgi:hypothetical protein
VVPHVRDVLAADGGAVLCRHLLQPAPGGDVAGAGGPGDRCRGPAVHLDHGGQRASPRPTFSCYAAARMGAEPARTLVIEDSLTGIRAGLAAGMTVWRFTGGSHIGPDTPEEPADPAARAVCRFAEFFQIAPELKAPT